LRRCAGFSGGSKVKRRFDGDVRLRGGIDLGGTKIQAAIVDASDSVRGEARRPTPMSGGPAGVAAELAATVGEAAEAAGVATDDLVGVGVGSPGSVDRDAGTVAEARNLPDWEGSFPLAAALQERLGASVWIGNDVQVATEAEARLGAGRDSSSLLGVFWGTGVGGGIVLDGRMWTGRGSAGEIGHTVVRQGGARCGCGRRGCLEAYAGRSSMEARARRLHAAGEKTELFEIMEHQGRTRLTSGVWARALRRRDPLAVALLERAVKALGTGIASAVNLLDVETVVIGGGLGVRLGAHWAARIEEAMKPHLFVDDRPPAVRTAALGDLGGAIGAALLVPSPAPITRS
jgi:glucokinase